VTASEAGAGFAQDQVGPYSLWLKRVLQASRAAGASSPLVMFDSSVPEPAHLLAERLRALFADGMPDSYLPVFGDGNPRLVENLAQAYEVTPDMVVPTTGATAALSILFRSLAGRGDHVLIERPGFDLFATLAGAAGLEVGLFPRIAPHFAIDPEAILARAKPTTRLIVISDLHNPSGMLAERDSLVTLARAAAERGITVIVDEVYAGYADPQVRPEPANRLGENVVSVCSLTKLYGLSALRCGWIVAAPQLIRRVQAVAGPQEFGVSKLAHCVATEIIENPTPFADYSLSIVARARPVVLEHFDRMREEELIDGLVPAYGCIAFPRLRQFPNSLLFAETLAADYGVLVTPGEFFGAAGHVRLGFGRAPELVDEALGRFAEMLRAARDKWVSSRSGE